MRIVLKSKKVIPPPPQVSQLINKLLDTPDDDVHEVLSQIDYWKWPRSDLNAWTKVLNKFDALLEDAIRDYDIDKLQVNVFTPLTKKTVCEILRFERLLLENSTNRKTFNSYDRLNSLMFTSDLDVLILALNLLLRPAQQYSAQPAVLHALSISTPRLTSLAKRWPNLREYDVNLPDLVSDKGKTQIEALPNEAREVNFTFYRHDVPSSVPHKEKEKSAESHAPQQNVAQTPTRRTGTSSSATASAPVISSGAVNIHISIKTIEAKEPMHILADIIEAYSVPDSEKFELLCRIRAARALTAAHAVDREKLVIVRLLATAIFGHTHPENQAQSSLFLYEAELITHIAELLQLDDSVDVQVQTAAIAALDALARYRSKVQDVLTAVNAGVNHGILMSLMRRTVAEVAQPSSALPQSFVESLLSFVTYIATHASGGNMVVGAGLIPILIQIIENRLPNRLYVVSKTMQLVDNVLYGFNNAFQLFCNARGVEVLVDRIEYEVDLDLEEHAVNEPLSDISASYGKLSVAQAAVLKHTLRSMHRMMQSSGTTEGLRGLLDSSLLKSVKKIMQNRSIFGPSVLPIAINIMATFVHNEPTCLPVVQEAGLPEAFYCVVESGLEPVIEVIQAVPNAIGALCLNQAGQDQLAARPNIIPGLFSIFTSERHQRVLQEKENSVLIGTAIEELIRHHPSLKQSVFNAIKATMDKIYELGMKYVPTDDVRRWYVLQPSTSSSATSGMSDADVTMMPVEDEGSQQVGAPALDGEAAIESGASGRDDPLTRSHDNVTVSFIDVLCKFLEGFFQHIPHCRDFLADQEALDRLGKLTTLPCLPYDFANSVASDSIVQVVRTMAEAETSETIAFLVRLVHESLEGTKEFWSSMQEESQLLALVDVTDSAEEVTRANLRLRQLITLHIRTSLLSDIYATAGYSHGRAASALLQSLTGPSARDILSQLGTLHRACIWENVVFKAALISQGLDSAPSSEITVSGSQTPISEIPTAPSTLRQLERTTITGGASNGVQGATSTAAPGRPEPVKVEGSRQQNAQALKHVASQIPSALAPFFQAVVRLFQTRRTADNVQKQKIQETAAILADILVSHLEQKPFVDKLSLLAYYTVMLGLATILLVDERTTQKTLYTVLLASFSQRGGIDAILGLCRAFVITIQTVTQVAPEERSDAAKQELVHAYGGLKVALHLLHPIISAKPLFESAQTSLLLLSEKKENDPDYFEPHNFLVRMRASVIPLLCELWEASWLASAPLGVSKSVVHIVMEMLNAEGEESKEPNVGPSTLMSGGFTIARAAGPDETRIRQLVEMGFPRSAAERALTRTRNNLTAATDLLLAAPFPYPPDPEPNAPAAAPEPPTDDQVMAVEEPQAADTGSNAEPSAPAVEADIDSSLSEVVDAPIKTAEEWLNELNVARESLKKGLGKHALRLVDEHSSLVFDVQKVFVGSPNEYREQAVNDLIADIKAFSPSAYDIHEQPMAARCRLLALVLHDPSSSLSQSLEKDVNQLMDILLALLLSNPTNAESGHPALPKWLAAYLLIMESLLLMGEEPRSIQLPKEDDPINQEPLTVGRHYPEARTLLFDFCLRLLAIPSLPKDELLSVLRLFVLLTQEHRMAEEFMRRDGITMLFQYMKVSASTSSATGIQSHIAMILRHIAEDASTLQNIMRQEVRRFFSHPRNHSVEVGSYVIGCNALALRDPASFVQVTQEICQLSRPFSGMKSVSLKEEAKTRNGGSTARTDSKGSEMQVDESVSHNTRAPSEPLETLVHFLIGELIKSVKDEQAGETSGGEQSEPRTTEGAGAASSSSPMASSIEVDQSERQRPDDREDYVYSCFLMQCLTELLFSYDSCKLAFLSYSPKKRAQISAKENGLRHKPAAIHFLLTEVMSFGTINPQPPADARKRIMLCNWAMSVIVALCVDISSTQDFKDVPSDLVSVRKFVLEAISRTIKDVPSSENPETRYSRLLALADLCYRLLTVRFNTNPRKANEEIPTHIAKIMLEKNFVATLTNALAEVDLNYPNIRGVVTAILRPIEYLSKIAIKMSRVSEKTKDILDEKMNDIESVISEEEEEEEEEEETSEHGGEETPDLYRNSALGLFGGEMEDVNYGPEGVMDEDVDEDENDVEMDFGDETGSEDTSATEEDIENDLDDDLENESGESEEGWQDEEGEESEDLVENNEGDIDEEGDEEEEDEGEEVLWQDIAAGNDGAGGAEEEADEDEEIGAESVPIMHMDMDEEAEMASEEDEFGEGIADQVPTGSNIFELAAGFANPLSGGVVNTMGRAAQPLFWAGSMRHGRRRHLVDDDLEIFGRPRPTSGSAPETLTHPLLVDPASTSTRSSVGHARNARRLQRNLMFGGQPHDLLQTIEDAIGEDAVQFFQHLMSHGRGGAGETIRIDVPTGPLGAALQRNGRGTISASIRLERAPRPGEARLDGRNLEPLLTVQRWLEEVKMLHGKFEQSRLSKLSNHVALALLPAAVKAINQAKLAEEARQREERIRAEQAALEEKEAAERARLEEEAANQQANAPVAAEGGDGVSQAVREDADTEMIDVSGPPDTAEPRLPVDSASETTNEGVAEGSSAAAERVTVMIHGNPVDITDTGIDPTFLEALPDDMREEVINQHVRDQRAARVERPADSQISPEFLDALPPEIRAEILQQESVERARQRLENATQGGEGVPADIDPASFLATLDPQLRQLVLMDSGDAFIQSLPSQLLAEAGIQRENLLRTSRPHAAARNDSNVTSPPQQGQKMVVSRDAIQLLDKASIATLVRLLFFPNTLKKNLLYKVLVNLCENSKTRTDLFNLLLNILQDGSGDLASIDKSFAQMSFRTPKQPNQQTPKAVGKQRIPSDYFGSLVLPQTDLVPELVVQRCLEALTYIVSANELSSLFFLTEHELPIGLRRNASKKGKGKEKQVSQSHYPVVLLLSLLDRPSILKTPSIVESVVTLLATVTRPLASLKDFSKKTAGDMANVTAETSNEQPAQGTSEAPAAPPAESSAPPEGTQNDAGQAKPARPEEKVLLTQPPVIPHTVMRFIVNILTAGECSGRTFSQSLALIQHLSFVPDARDVIANELRSRAQEFGHSLYTALDELATALRESQGDVLAGSITSKFSPASSDQAKLLRVLKTIDYMYSPKATPLSTASDADVEKVQAIYESFKFAPLWQRLGDCLAIIEEKPEMEHIATVLLPLIESLMVVCKYVGAKATNGGTARLLRASVSPRSPTTTRESMEDLFVSFTDAHRKVLNLMVRNNPSLMSGSFSLLVNNPRVLDFDNKRNYFNQQLHRRPHSREHHGTLQLNVRRPRVFEDSFQYLQRKTGEQIKYGKLSVRFYDEEGVDAGGVTREWFQILARQMFDPNYALFQPCAADRLTYQPNKASWVNPEHLSFFKFVGRVIGKAIYDGRLLDAYFARSLYRQILGKPVDYKDVEWVDPEYYNSLCWILDNDPSALELTFSVEADEFGVMKIVDLKENGRTIPVTQENKREFVQLSAQYRLYSSIKEQIEALLAGFYEIIPKDLISIFNEQELELLISGTPDIDVDEWRAATEYNGYTSSDPVIVWWWRALKSFNREERAKVLSFATGTSRVPLGGFTELQGVQGVQRFSIHRAYGDTDRLPQAHTCFNQIDLPQYSSYEMLRQQLLLAIIEGAEGFGFA
ncbi:uncharacterized protein LAESUDRAFT_721398 [Laetiporus sulphureus 93-53]|uniref:HECT-type E3 ubiquitin transferase n=1 Tax=Laetiporus sulphureus 93-53 TaxID=1314785 RepID=A0A165GXW6_9APHY|nr:uncharacterized protein LAESUDRAFT_721398 [Laetiporus sulphureus 93-53]KZT10978.1 hypothetical protein LAESUDRAFT_721398 [Laetiporus sulphureus 93-53]